MASILKGEGHQTNETGSSARMNYKTKMLSVYLLRFSLAYRCRLQRKKKQYNMKAHHVIPEIVVEVT